VPGDGVSPSRTLLNAVLKPSAVQVCAREKIVSARRRNQRARRARSPDSIPSGKSCQSRRDRRISATTTSYATFWVPSGRTLSLSQAGNVAPWDAFPWAPVAAELQLARASGRRRCLRSPARFGVMWACCYQSEGRCSALWPGNARLPRNSRRRAGDKSPAASAAPPASFSRRQVAGQQRHRLARATPPNQAKTICSGIRGFSYARGRTAA